MSIDLYKSHKFSKSSNASQPYKKPEKKDDKKDKKEKKEKRNSLGEKISNFFSGEPLGFGCEISQYDVIFQVEILYKIFEISF